MKAGDRMHIKDKKERRQIKRRENRRGDVFMDCFERCRRQSDKYMWAI
jgi:hypothetical protein